jgi:hypothetical protein
VNEVGEVVEYDVAVKYDAVVEVDEVETVQLIVASCEGSSELTQILAVLRT